MPDENPYAAPVDDRLSKRPPVELDKRVWRKGLTLVLERGAQLPARCIKCNSSHDLLFKSRRYTCTSFNLALTAKATTVLLGICPACNQRRGAAIAWGSLLTLLGTALLTLAIYRASEPILLAGILVFLVGVGWLYRSQLAVVAKIDRATIHLRGICREYLGELPSSR